MKDEIKEAIKIIKDGGVVIFPTDTAFGIGCRIDNEKAVKRLFRIRKRPESQAVPVLVDSVKMAEEYVEIPKDVQDKLIKQYWPGGLTIILRCIRMKVQKLVRGGKDTIGIRIPDHPITKLLIQEVRVPILGPSANFHGEKTPYELNELNKNLINKVDYVVSGECTIKQESTVVDCTVKPWKVLREGAVRISES